MCHPKVLAIKILQNPQSPVVARDRSSLLGFPTSGHGERYGYLDLS